MRVLVAVGRELSEMLVEAELCESSELYATAAGLEPGSPDSVLLAYRV